MDKYTVDKGFRATGEDSEQRRKGDVVELSGKELDFAHDNKCVTKFKKKKEK